MVPIYFLTAGVSAGLVGVFGRHIIAQLGFVSDFQTGVLLASGIACAYLAVQFLYWSLVRLLMPTRNGWPLFFESCSHGAALLLLPYLVGINVPWPASILHTLEPLIYLAVFGGAHAFFKLVSFFAATQAPPSNRFGTLFWAGCCAASLLGAAYCLNQWYMTLIQARYTPLGVAQAQQVDTVWRPAQPLLEGAFYTLDVPNLTGKTLSLGWANPPDARERLREIHVTVELVGSATTTLLHNLEMEPETWTELLIPAGAIPNDTKSCTIFWHAQEEAEWIRQTGLRPVQLTDRTMLMAGPHFNLEQEQHTVPNVVVIALEGLGAEHVGALGYSRNNTPSLDQFSGGAMTYTYAYSPAPEAAAACMTLLTGVDPLRHGFLGGQVGPLPSHIQTLPEVLGESGYATAAFTEGTGTDEQDLVYGSGFEQGFQYFNADVPLENTPGTDGPVTPRSLVYAGANVTLDRAADWIGNNHQQKFMVFVRVRELREPMRLPRYGRGYIGNQRNPDDVDVYDTAVNWLDHQLGRFFSRMQEMGVFENTCIVITSPYGMDFDANNRNPRPTLSESSLRVPLFLRIPGEEGRQRSGIVQLQDVAPTILNLTGTAFAHPISGDALLNYTLQREPAISMAGNPLILTVRDGKWRFAWNSGLQPFTWEQVHAEEMVYMWDMDRYRLRRQQRDNVQENPLEAQDYTELLRQFIQGRRATATVTVDGN